MLGPQADVRWQFGAPAIRSEGGQMDDFALRAIERILDAVIGGISI